jgi:hypothetical protein
MNVMNHIKYGLVSRFAETKDVNPKSVRHTVEVVDRSRIC